MTAGPHLPSTHTTAVAHAPHASSAVTQPLTIPTFQLEVEEPTRMNDLDEGFGDDVFEVGLFIDYFFFQELYFRIE